MDTKNAVAIIKEAQQYGFDDARIAPWGMGSVLVLFARYAPAQSGDASHIHVSSYYIASNRAYANAEKLAEALSGMGILAQRDSSLPAKHAALATGGWIGRNGFYYHPAFGSLVHIQTLLLAELPAGGVAPAMDSGCNHCGACINACPCGAVTEDGLVYSRCLRTHMNGTVPDELKPFVYQLYGCERCQTACPMNNPAQAEYPAFDLELTIRGGTLEELQGLAGKNMARTVRTINQAILYAANVCNTAVMPVVLDLKADVRFADACRYYLGRLKKKD